MNIPVTIYGKDFLVDQNPSDFWGWVKDGRYNTDWEVLKRLVHSDHTFIDLGAWIGSHSLYASTIAKRTIAVEPDPVAFQILQTNLKDRPGVSALQVAITGHEGMITLGSGLLGASTTRENPDAGGGIGAWAEDQQVEVPCMTLRQLIEREKVTQPLFLKLDTEGSEEQIVKDFAFFEEYRPTIFLETHPFWWKNEKTAWENIRRLLSLYGSVRDIKFQPFNLDANYPRHLIFTGR